jgi:phage terminase large subunit
MVYWVAPTFSTAREIGFDEFIKYKDILKPAIHSIHNSRLKVTFKNGSSMYFKGSDDPDSLRGRGLTLVIGDESAFIKPEVWSKILRPALSDRNGKAILVSTPNGFNWFKNLFDNESEWSKYHWVTSLNPLISAEELIAVQSDISRDEYRQEYLAEFITRAGRVYDEFNEENIIEQWKPNPQEWSIYLGMDFGFAHHTAITFMAVEKASNNKIIQFDELYINKTQMDDIIKRIKTKLYEYNIDKYLDCSYTDPAGNADELSSGLSPVDMLRNAGFNIVNKGSTINSGIALIRSYIKNSLGERRFFVTKNCIETIKCFNGYQYNILKNGNLKEEPLKDNIHDHLMDADRYFFVNRFDHAKYVASVPGQSNYTTSRLIHRVFKKCCKCGSSFLSNTLATEPPFACSGCLNKGL